MAQNYTKMWEAFFSGEWDEAGGASSPGPLDEGDEGARYLEQTKSFYENVVGPSFGLEGFGSTDLGGMYAQFSNVDFERAERDFRSEIGDIYAGGDDPFSWEKVSRYNTEDSFGIKRIQELLEDELYGQGKLLGGDVGADYGTSTAKGLEAYTTGLRGEREALSYESLIGETGTASGTGGSVLRSGGSVAVAEDALIEAYKKTKTLGSEYKEGTAEIEQTLSEDLDTALTRYLTDVDKEKQDWFGDVMQNVRTFKQLNVSGDDELLAWTDEQLEAEMNLYKHEHYNNWSCGYGQAWNSNSEKCEDTWQHEEEVEGYTFRDDVACGIGMIYNVDLETCEVRSDLHLVEDNYGLLCAQTTTCHDDKVVCDPNECGTDPLSLIGEGFYEMANFCTRFPAEPVCNTGTAKHPELLPGEDCPTCPVGEGHHISERRANDFCVCISGDEFPEGGYGDYDDCGVGGMAGGACIGIGDKRCDSDEDCSGSVLTKCHQSICVPDMPDLTPPYQNPAHYDSHYEETGCGQYCEGNTPGSCGLCCQSGYIKEVGWDKYVEENMQIIGQDITTGLTPNCVM